MGVGVITAEHGCTDADGVDPRAGAGSLHGRDGVANFGTRDAAGGWPHAHATRHVRTPRTSGSFILPNTWHFATLRAEAAIAAAEVRPEELPATSFGVPFVVRAFNSRPEAASFIRGQPVHHHHHHHHKHHHHHGHGHRHQQHRETHTQAAAAAPGSEYSLIFSPPPPPFVVQGTAYFAPLVRQSVLYDEYGSEVGVQLRVMRGQRAEEVRYLSAPEALEQQQRMVGSQQQRQHFAPVSGQSGQGRGQGEGTQPRGQAGGALGRPDPQAQEQQSGAAAAATATATAAAAAAAAATGAAASLPMPDALLQKLRGVTETQQEEQAARTGETGGSLAASSSGPAQAEQAPIAAEAAGGQGKGGGRRERKPRAKAAAAVAAAGSDGATAVGVAVAVGEGGAAAAAGGAGAQEGEKRKRGRPKGSKNKAGAGGKAQGGAGDGGSAAVQSAVASASAAVGVSVSAVTVATAGLSLTHGYVPPSAGPPPMPSSRLLSNALRGAGGGGVTGAPRAPLIQQPQPQPGMYQQVPAKPAGLPAYGYVAPAPAPQPPPYGGGATPHYAAGGGRRAVQGTPYGGPLVVPVAPVGGYAAVRPAPYRPPSPPLAMSVQQAAAAAATAATARGRPAAPMMGR